MSRTRGDETGRYLRVHRIPRHDRSDGSGHHLRVHRVLPHSRANGPGRRAVLWVQGCSLGCPGCFNPETHAPDPASLRPVADVAAELLSIEGTDGLTVSGGEPLQQLPALNELLRRLRAATDWSLLVLTGFSWDEVRRLPGSETLLRQIDALVAGRYLAGQRLARGLRGSVNKTLHLLTPRHTAAEIDAVPEAEILIDAGGEVLLSGVDPLVWETT